MSAWRSVKYAAKYYGRSVPRIIAWCKDGTLSEAKIPVYQDKSKRWWICIPQ